MFQRSFMPLELTTLTSHPRAQEHQIQVAMVTGYRLPSPLFFFWNKNISCTKYDHPIQDVIGFRYGTAFLCPIPRPRGRAKVKNHFYYNNTDGEFC